MNEESCPVWWWWGQTTLSDEGWVSPMRGCFDPSCDLSARCCTRRLGLVACSVLLYPHVAHCNLGPISIFSTHLRLPLLHNRSRIWQDARGALSGVETICSLLQPKFYEMAQAMAAAALAPVAGLGMSTLSVRAARSKVQLTSSFVQRASCSTAPQFENAVGMSRITCFNRDWLRKDLSVIGFGLIGWLAPSSLPIINGNSLTGLFFGSIGPELAHWPTGPSLTSPFWLWLVTWHLGLFIVLTLGQIGFKGRKDGYFQ